MITPIAVYLNSLNPELVLPTQPVTEDELNKLSDIINPLWAQFLDSNHLGMENFWDLLDQWCEYTPFTPDELSAMEAPVYVELSFNSDPNAFIYKFNMYFIPLTSGVVLRLSAFKILTDQSMEVLFEHAPTYTVMGSEENMARMSALDNFITQQNNGSFDVVTLTQKIIEFGKNYRHN